VFALVGDDGRGMVWPESMPLEIASEVEREVKRNGLEPIRGGSSRADGAQAHGPQPSLAHSPSPSPGGGRSPALAFDDAEDLPEPRRLKHPLHVVRDDDDPGGGPHDGGNGGGASKKKKRSSKKVLPPYMRVVK
jgi:hypothetical protein